MCSPLFNYTWTLYVGHEIPATISVLETSPENARGKIVRHITAQAKTLESISAHESTHPRALEAAASVSGDINRKLRICAAAAVGIPMNEFKNQISAKNISFALDKLLQTVEPAVETAEKPQFAWDREPKFVHYVSSHQ
jgi:hypothetical protein